ncbi:MAG: 5'-nucleotidase, lipoprotein e(P4) family [Oligoflexia bacterium]|nr:5'-nucleotidase, lipoprotein e(P4) family [Oligoflexia bacterium]MBF0366537.1 5'-nucleotidase, lipoprotein e(P4) family [Oligoflexia bacterium]
MSLNKNLLVTLLFMAISLLAFSGCATNTTKSTGGSSQDHLLSAVLWFQTSAEYKALSYQAYNLAKDRLDQEIAKHRKSKSKKPLAIVLDIDETVLDNSPYQAKLIQDNKSFSSDSWKEWTLKAIAKPLPGAADFLKYAESKKIAIFYVTNRKGDEEVATLENLKKENLPLGHLILRNGPSSKEERRNKVSNTHNIVLLFGDNLNDFSKVFEDKNIADRAKETDSLRLEFGKRFIVFPNPMYGDWESSMFKSIKDKNSDTEKYQIRKSSLQSF